uniref:Intraflagellar transport protein 46 homolog n=1 Tax=Mesocestoides corti TaxID=53468 RepID=A0A5K3EJ63_MESCO
MPIKAPGTESNAPNPKSSPRAHSASDKTGEEGDAVKKTKAPPANNSSKAGGRDSSDDNASGAGGIDDEDDVEDDEDDENNDSYDTSNSEMNDGLYNPAYFDHLVVSAEVKEMFQYIQRYTPQSIELETKLRPFIPEYIAAVGDIDAFLKVPRPDGKPDNLGLTVLDEPCTNQSDPTVLDLQLRAVSKQKTSKEMVIRDIKNAEENGKEIDKWIKSIGDLHRSKPPPTVHYVKPMPDLTTLMTEWPVEFEKTLNTTVLPTAVLNCSLSEYVDIVSGKSHLRIRSQICSP